MKRVPLSTWLGRSGAWALSLAIHAGLLVWLLAATLAVTPAPPPPVVALELVRLPPPPPPLPQEARIEPRKTPTARTPQRPTAPMPPRAIQPAAPVAIAPPAHGFAQRQDDWAAPGPLAAAAGGGTSARRAPPGYADEVKARIVAKLEYPANHFTKVKDREGNIVIIRRECSIPYEITVDRQGRMISHRIESCGDGVLDAAAEAALLKAGPFPPPPDTGAEEYVIYGSANLFVDSYGAKSGVRR